MGGGRAPEPLRFGLLADLHLRAGDEGAAMAEAAGRCLQSFGQNGCAFIAQLGDLLAGTPGEADRELQLALELLRQAPCPVRHVVGNHCLELPYGELTEAFGLERSWYRFDHGGWRFLVLDGMEVSVARQPENETDRQSLAAFTADDALPRWCGAVGSRQKAWLAAELALAKREERPIIVLCHFPLHPATTDQRHGLLWNHEEIRSMLIASGAVAACIGGHYHKGAYASEGGLDFIVLPAFSLRQECCACTLEEHRLLITGRNGRTLLTIERQPRTQEAP